MRRVGKIALALLLLISSACAYDATPETNMVPVAGAVRLVSYAEVTASTALSEVAANAVTVQSPYGNGYDTGSGVYLGGLGDGTGVVATANHVIQRGGNGLITFRDGKRFQYRVIEKDAKWDQALLLIKEHPTLNGVEISTDRVQIGQTVYSMGFGRGFRVFGGQVRGFVGNGSGGTDWLYHASPAVPGDSGGPIVTPAGQLVSCLWGTGGGCTYGSRNSRFLVLCRPLLPRLAQWRANRLGRLGVTPKPPRCENGVCTPPSGPVVPSVPADEDVTLEPPTNQGPPGAIGPQGPPGRDGTDAVVTELQLAEIADAIRAELKNNPANQPDINELAAAVALRLPPISLALIDTDGRELDRDTVPIGGTLKLQLYERE